MAESLQERIEQDLKTALKEKDKIVLSTLRLLKSDLQYELAKDGSDSLPDDRVEALLKRAIKRRKDSIEQFTKAGKAEMAAAEEAEMAVLRKYLPESLSEEAILAEIEAVFAQVQPEGPKDMGKVMGAVMARLKGKNADGALVKDLVLKKLNG